MALALNTFRTVVGIVSTSPESKYTAPVGYTAVFLLAQVTNIGSTSEDITVLHRRSVNQVTVETEILKEYPISSNDTLNLFSGKLILESGDSLILYGSDGTNLKFVGSILETLS